MKSKTLSKVTWVVFVWFLVTIILVATDVGQQFLSRFMSIGETNILVALPSFSLFFCFFSRVVSYLGLSAHKGQSIENIKFSYRYFYILLTEEARQDWRDFIAKEQRRVSKTSSLNN